MTTLADIDIADKRSMRSELEASAIPLWCVHQGT